MSAILWSWAISAVVLIVIAVLLGMLVRLPSEAERPKPRWLGILVDDRGRFSLNRTQLVLWSIVVLSLIAGVFFGRLIEDVPEPLEFTIPGNVLGLLGISVGTAVTVGAVKASKSTEAHNEVEKHNVEEQKQREAAPAAQAAAGGQAPAGEPAQQGGPAQPAAPAQPPVQEPPRAAGRLATLTATGREPFLAQVFMVEEGEYADDVVDVTKFQSFALTIVLVVAYVAMAVNTIVEANSAAKVTALPDLKGTFLVLLGISYAGYAGGKLPPRAGAPRVVEGSNS